MTSCSCSISLFHVWVVSAEASSTVNMRISQQRRGQRSDQISEAMWRLMDEQQNPTGDNVRNWCGDVTTWVMWGAFLLLFYYSKTLFKRESLTACSHFTSKRNDGEDNNYSKMEATCLEYNSLSNTEVNRPLRLSGQWKGLQSWSHVELNVSLQQWRWSTVNDVRYWRSEELCKQRAFSFPQEHQDLYSCSPEWVEPCHHNQR